MNTIKTLPFTSNRITFQIPFLQHKPTIIQHKVLYWQIHPAEETSHFQVSPLIRNHTPAECLAIYTNGPRTDAGVAV